MGLNTQGIIDALVSNAQSTGYFTDVLGHEPISAPAQGITCAVWFIDGRVIPLRSGLDTVSAFIKYSVRLYTAANAQPQDEVDTDILTAMDSLMKNYCGDFTLDGSATYIDLMNIVITAGYQNIDSTLYRYVDIALPVVSDDLWLETE